MYGQKRVKLFSIINVKTDKKMKKNMHLMIMKSIYIYTASPPHGDYMQVRVCGMLVEEL